MTTTTNNFLELLNKMTLRTNAIAKELRRSYNAREWQAKHGAASIQDVAASMARKEFS